MSDKARDPLSGDWRRWTVPEAAALYRVDERTIRNWIEKRAIEFERKGRTVRVHIPSWTATGTAGR